MTAALTALTAALAMLGQDLLSTWLVQAEAGYRPVLAGVLDTLNWPMSMAVTYTAVTALQGHDTALKVAVCAAVSAANFSGTSGATQLGKRLGSRRPARCCPHCPEAAS